MTRCETEEVALRLLADDLHDIVSPKHVQILGLFGFLGLHRGQFLRMEIANLGLTEIYFYEKVFKEGRVTLLENRADGQLRCYANATINAMQMWCERKGVGKAG